MVQLTPLQKHKQSLETDIWHFGNVSFSCFSLPEKCQCKNSQASETPAACPDEHLPWDLVVLDKTEGEYQCH